MNTAERGLHPSRGQIEFLLEFLGRNPSLVKGFSKEPSARAAARRCWEILTLQLNSLDGCVKTWKQWTKYWADKKSAVKKKSELSGQNKNGAVVKLNDIEKKILMLISRQSIATDIKIRCLNLGQTPPPNTTTPSPLRQRLVRDPPLCPLSQSMKMTERLLAKAEQRIEVDRRNLQLFETIINREKERDTATTQAMLAIGEGLKLLAEALKK